MLGTNFVLIGAVSNWITPVWLLGLGIALGLAVLVAAYGILTLVAPRTRVEMAAMVKEGWLLPLFYVAVLAAILTAAATVAVPYQPLIASAMRTFAVGSHSQKVVVPAKTRDHAIPLPFRPAELQGFALESDQPLTVATKIEKRVGPEGTKKLEPGSQFKWQRLGTAEKVYSREVGEWSATNVGETPATLTMDWRTDIEFPEVRLILNAALAVIGLFLAYVALRLLFPKISAIALATSKEASSQPIFYVCMALGCTALLAFLFIPYNTFGEDIKMLKDSGLTLIMVLSILVAVWSASVSIADEIEGKTALTVLSKPVSRRQFILGKFLGIMGPVILMFVILGLLFMVTIPYKVVYDSKEMAQTTPPWQIGHMEMVQTLPGLILAFLETVVLASIAVALSTRLPMMANLMICSSIYVLGHLVPMLVNSSVGKFEIVRFVGQFIAVLLPVLDHFNIQAAVAAGVTVPWDYMAWAFAYCVLYSTVAMLLALALFEGRDLA